MRRTLIALAIAAAVAMPFASQAKTLRWAAQGDILTFDPHSQNEGMTIAANSYVYEPLVDYDKDFKVVPRLATSWEQVSPTLYRFKLREGVKFHDGAPFTADDAVFSIHRAMAPTSNYKAYTTGIKEARKVDDHTIEIETTAPNPVLLRQLPNVFIMNRAWSEKHNVAKPQDFVNKEETFAARNTNGTGPYKLKSREVDVRTTFEENPDWWNKKDKVGNVTEVVFTPIKQNATRTAALLSGEIDFVLDPAAQDLDRLRQQAKVVEGNEYRTIYIGYDQKRPELLYSSIKGKNPFQDARVREALYRAIDADAIKRAVMRGLSAPTGTMIAPQVHGWTEDLHKRVPYDPEKARALLKEAGYDGTLNFTLDCPNNRYINDEAICQAIVGMWAKVGVKAALNAMPRATYFPKVQSNDTSVYLFGWGVPTFDAMYTLQNLIHSKGEGADGMYNIGNYSNKDVDAIIDRVKTETDAAKRDAYIHKALEIHAKEFGHIPLHDQVIPWAMRKNVSVIHRADNRLVADWVKVD
ncbi:ABC transporter substrate-binding protein [Bordetella holmesii]|uniref:ABC transporter, substrate-binding protein, family 5 n=2 Tax=Bordetella holmesii TaxID=35814 RepID=A0A158M8L3_9BORD|nr:ABC transporter substrate-binding protein [Bordetella holmesii]AIT25022.1 bacterial extracellular solute-binding s, 5 Middle family protein [Bordetella holmesii 44057]EWM45588.1 bacterial extracellular solute-binding s, 5 Middle family protein [Bordetella holmesii 70147]AMD44276.1 ABC transporter substrate-binding protein [Bordetella holmesii H558]AMD50193.1 ABC transporter substrate-binding protein [Bordetella holmesii F627]AOB36385.1 ABC transporter substrate-binding protein [Bordetella h